MFSIHKILVMTGSDVLSIFATSLFCNQPVAIFNFLALCDFPGDSQPRLALYYILGNQHYLCQLFQLQQGLIG